jgi:hypothetical protein
MKIEDRRLERLYDYTKFHIGIYLSAAGGLAALISTAAESSEKKTYIDSLIGIHWALAFSFAFMTLAGIAGAVVATATINSETYNDFLTEKHGAYGLKLFSGRRWVGIEHSCFWLSLVFLGVGIFSADAIANWL